MSRWANFAGYQLVWWAAVYGASRGLAQALRTRGADYRDYQQRTSMLFPWPPRRRPADHPRGADS